MTFNLKTVILGLLVFAVTGLFLGNMEMAIAQDQKIGYVNTDQILSKMPEYKGVKKTLRNLSQEWKDRIKKMEKEIQNMKEEFEAKEILYTEEVRKKKRQQIQAKIKQKETFLENKFSSGGDYFKKQKELLEPIQRKVMKAVNSVAEQQGFDYVFDRAGDISIMYARQEWNLNNEVLVELGITVDQSSK